MITIDIPKKSFHEWKSEKVKKDYIEHGVSGIIAKKNGTGENMVYTAKS